MGVMDDAPSSIERQIAAEKAAALGRSGKKLQVALEKLRRFDETARRGGRIFDPAARDALVDIAGEALWSYIVQREAIGLIDAEYIAREYGVPPDVRLRMRPRVAVYQG
jgi:hypothetical protein